MSLSWGFQKEDQGPFFCFEPNSNYVNQLILVGSISKFKYSANLAYDLYGADKTAKPYTPPLFFFSFQLHKIEITYYSRTF